MFSLVVSASKSKATNGDANHNADAYLSRFVPRRLVSVKS